MDNSYFIIIIFFLYAQYSPQASSACSVLVYFDMEVNLNKYGHKPHQLTVPCSLPELTKERTCTVVSANLLSLATEITTA